MFRLLLWAIAAIGEGATLKELAKSYNVVGSRRFQGWPPEHCHAVRVKIPIKQPFDLPIRFLQRPPIPLFRREPAQARD